MHPNNTHFPVLPSLPAHPCDLSSKKEKKRKWKKRRKRNKKKRKRMKNTAGPICVAHILPLANPLEKTETSPSTLLPEAYSLLLCGPSACLSFILQYSLHENHHLVLGILL